MPGQAKCLAALSAGVAGVTGVCVWRWRGETISEPDVFKKKGENSISMTHADPRTCALVCSQVHKPCPFHKAFQVQRQNDEPVDVARKVALWQHGERNATMMRMKRTTPRGTLPCQCGDSRDQKT